MFKRLTLVGLLILSASGAAACGTTDPSSVISTSITFASRIQEKGSAWKGFTTTSAGTVSVQLTSVSQGAVVMGLGLGTVSGTTCNITQSIETAPNSTATSPQISTTLAAGTYCVKVSDIGNLTTIVDFIAVILSTPSS